MKSTRGSLLILGFALTALAAVGCAGSGGGTTLVNATDRSKVAQLLKDVFAGRSQIQAAPSGPGRSKVNTAQPSQPKMARLEEGDLQVGQVTQFADDLWGRIEAVSYDTFQGYRSVTKLDYKYFKDEGLTQYAGFNNYLFNVEADGTGYTFTETELDKPSGPPYYKKEEIWGRLGEYYKNDFVEVTDLSGNGGPDRVRIEGGSEWLGGDSSTFYVRYPIRGEIFSATGKSFANGGLEVAWTTASGFRVEIQYDRDWNAVFSIKGENPLLPASGQFDVEGKGTITFKDGTQADFDYYNNDFFVTR